ncbi:MAG: LysM domain-containing protein [Verrucomicrobiota bacterium]
MHRWFRFSTVIALVMFSHGGYAQEASEPGAAPSKHRQKPSLLQSLQDQIEAQGKQIEAQTKQLEDLNKRTELESKALEQQGKLLEEQTRQFGTLNDQLTRFIAANKTRDPGKEAPVAAAIPAAEPAQAAPQAGAPTVETSSTPSAEVPMAGVAQTAPPASATHIVKRGENLISIAHQHSTTVAELLKLNKITDERKLQIGQTLLLPSPSPTASPQP